NQDGVSDAGELQSLEIAGIVEIDLVSDGMALAPLGDGTRLQGRSTYTDTNDEQHAVGDVVVAFQAQQASKMVEAMAAFDPQPAGASRAPDRPASSMAGHLVGPAA
ncbi:MAG: hypothetical protein ACR2PI_24845, partial [Hyphomicrobiaceae bacterium]